MAVSGPGTGILVVEDDADWRQLVRLWLKTAGYKDARFAETGRQGLRLAGVRPPDCVILDLQLGDMEGTEVVKRLRAQPRTADVPILMMTSFSAERAGCLRKGADYFIAKSPNGEELLATLEALFRRRDIDARLIRRGDLALRPDTREVFVAGASAGVLTPKTFELFVALIGRAPAPVPREELLGLVGNRDGPSRSRALDILVNRLRRSLPAELARRIRAVRGFGYAFLG